MIQVKKHADGWVVAVRVRPKARSNDLLDLRDGAIYLCVTAPPEAGKANQAAGVLLAESLGLRGNQVELIAGETSRNKQFLIRGIDVEDLLARIDAALTPTVYDPEIASEEQDA
ncbi:MAG: hypothetical protein KatS3mg108_1937 [Isosphaeraceae bacterium]|jgi:uncharacterized protein (TIGR00251 family)|nr:MAG: hypothetical protein KatS3mg108_1937 [Isosphaeraceae bacterium]